MHKKITAFILSLTAAFILLTSVVNAQSAYQKALDNLGSIGQKTGLGQVQTGPIDIYTRLANYLNVLLGLLGIIATIYVFFSGFKWIRAGGNEQSVTEAKDGIKSAIYGLMVVFSTYAIVNFVILKLIGSITAK